MCNFTFCKCETCVCLSGYCDEENPICDFCKIGSHVFKKYWKICTHGHPITKDGVSNADI